MSISIQGIDTASPKTLKRIILSLILIMVAYWLWSFTALPLVCDVMFEYWIANHVGPEYKDFAWQQFDESLFRLSYYAQHGIRIK